MDCTEFLARHTEFLDGEPVEELPLLQEHVRSCRVCGAYDRVVREALGFCRELPLVDPSPGFEERLRSRLERLEEELVAGPRFAGSSALAVVLILGFVVAAWLPAVVHRHEVALPPIVVTLPSRPKVALRVGGRRAEPGPERVSIFSAAWSAPGGLWRATPVSAEGSLATLWNPSLSHPTVPTPPAAPVSLADRAH